MARVAWLGLGTMGFPMAGYLAGHHHVCVYNRTASKAATWIETHGGHANEAMVCATPAEAARGADVVFACVGNDEDLRAVTLGEDGAFAALSQGALFVDHTTASAGVARELAQAAQRRGFGFVDAPVSGGQAGAERGALTVMCGGAESDYARAESFIGHYAKLCLRMGEVGMGQMTKMVNQILIAGLLQGLAEGMAFGKAAGLPMDKVIEVIGQGAAQSWQLDNRGQTMVEGAFDFGFAVQWMRKDLGLCLEEAQGLGVHLPVTALVDQFYARIVQDGGSRYDTSSLMLLLDRL